MSFRWLSCNNLSLSQSPPSSPPSSSSSSPGEGGDVRHIFRGAFGRTRTFSATSFTAEAHTAAAGGNASTAGRVEEREGGRNRMPFHLRTHRQSHQLCHSTSLRPGHSSSSSGGMGCLTAGGMRDGGISATVLWLREG